MIIFGAANAAGIVFLPLQIYAIAAVLPVLIFLCIRFPKTITLLLGLFLLFQELIALQFSDNSFVNMALKRSEEFIILAVFFGILVKNIFIKKSWRQSGIDLPFLGLIAVSILGTLRNNIVPYIHSLFDLFILLKGFFVFYIFYNMDLSRDEIVRVMKTFFVIAISIMALGMIDFMAPSFFRGLIHNTAYIDYRFGIPSVQSIFIHPGMYGWFMAFSATLAFAVFIVLQKRRYFIYAACFTLGMLLSMRFKPVAGLLFALAAAFFIIPAVKKQRFVFISLVLVVFFAFLFGSEMRLLLNDRIYSYFQSPHQYNIARNALYTASFRIAADYFPFGAGLGTFGGWISALYYSPLYSQYGLDFVYGLQAGGEFIVDTFWPYIIGQFGFFGLFFYLWILLKFLHRSCVEYKNALSPVVKAFQLGAFMVILEAIPESMASPIFLTPPAYFFIFGIMGITFSVAQRRSDAAEA